MTQKHGFFVLVCYSNSDTEVCGYVCEVGLSIAGLRVSHYNEVEIVPL